MPRHLAQYAEQLVAGRETPIDLVAILSALKIRLTVGAVADPKSRHSGGLRKSPSGDWEVVLLSRQGCLASFTRLTPRERFTIAHEIGHYVVDTRFGFRPRSNGEYWRLEAICDEFARMLLIPQWLVHKIVDKHLSNPVDLLLFTDRIAKSALVSAEPAARAVNGALTAAATLASLEIDRKQTRLGLLRWQISNCGWKAWGRNSKIDPAHPLAPALEASKGLAEGETRPVAIDGVKHACIERGKGARVFFAALHD